MDESEGETKRRITGNDRNSVDSASIKSLASSSSATIYPEPPDGGYGWVIVFSAFMAFLLADGIQLSIGLIYAEMQHYFDAGKGESAVITSVFLGVPLLAAPLVSPLIDFYDCRLCTIVGGIVTFIGVFTSVWAPNLAVLSLTFGLITGVGLSVIFSAPMIAVTYYFDKRRALASGIAASGSGFGTIIFAPVCEKLFHNYGWQGTLLVLSAILLNLVVCGFLLRDLEWPEDTLEYKTDKFLRALDAAPPASRLSGETSASVMTGPIGFVSRNWTGFPWATPELDVPPEAVRNAVSLIELPCFVREYLSQLPRDTKENVELPRQKAQVSAAAAAARKPAAKNMSKSVVAMPGWTAGSHWSGRRMHRRSYRLSGSDPDDLIVSDSDGSEEAEKKARSLSYIPELANDGSVCSFGLESTTDFDEEKSQLLTARSLEVSDENCTNDLTATISDSQPKLNGNLVSGAGLIMPTNGDVKNNDTCPKFPPGVPPSPGLSANDLSSIYPRSRLMSDFGITSRPKRSKQIPVYHHLRSQLAFSRYNAAKRVLSAPELRRLLRISRQKKSFKDRWTKIVKETKYTLKTDWNLMKSKTFFVMFLSHFLLYTFNGIPYVISPDLAEGTFGTQKASLLVSLLGVFNTLGMIFFGVVADRKYFNPCILMAVATGVSGLALLVVPYLPADSFASLAVVTVAFGFFMGAADGLSSVILVELFRLSGFVYAYGLINFACGIGNLVGPTLAGYLYDWTGAYTTTYVVGGVGTVLTGLMMGLLPVARRCDPSLASSEQSLHVVEGDDFVQIKRKKDGPVDV